MATIFPGRFAAQIEGPFVVFVIGMRVNRLFAFRRWMSVAAAMSPMLAELKRDPSLGLLHAEPFIYWRGVALLQYWRSLDQLQSYAHARNATHLPAWAEFNRRIGGDGSVGIWHETYIVAAGQYETVYANMPRFGLASASDHQPATGRLKTARSRMNMPEAENETGPQ